MFINYYKKAWRIAGKLQKHQYARLTTIIWWIIAAGILYIVATYNYADSASSEIIINVIEAIITVPIVCLLTYVNTRFFPWAKIRLPFQGRDKPLLQDVVESGEEAYRNTMKDGPQISGPDINISSGTTEIEDPEDTPINVPYSDIQNVKAKYGSNAGIYRNTGNGTPINTSETSNVQKKYGTEYGVYSEQPTQTREANTFDVGVTWKRESQKDLEARAKGDKWGMELVVLILRLIVAPVMDVMFNMFVWPFSFLIGPLKMRSIVKSER